MDKLKENSIAGVRIDAKLDNIIRKVQTEYSLKIQKPISYTKASEIIVYLYVYGINPNIIERNVKKKKTFAMVL
jgi:hypothetical protein